MFKFIIRPIKDRLAARKLKKGRKDKMVFPAKFAGYDPGAAFNLARLSEWAYPHGKAISTDYDSNEDFLVDMEDKKKKAAAWGFRDFNYVYAEDLKILAFILREGADVVISFRGTVIDSTINWQTDLQAQLIPMDSFGGVHKGFSEALDSIWVGIKSLISTRETQRIWLTGHSLGGALALMAGARLITEYRNSPHIMINGLYVFAAPRVGDRDFGDSYKNTYLDRRSFVFVHHNDIITVFPPFIKKISEYVNVGHILFINSEGAINAIDDLPELKILRQFLTGYFKEQFLAGFNKEKFNHDWQTFKNFFREVFSEIKPSISTTREESEHWTRFKNFFTKELPPVEKESTTEANAENEANAPDDANEKQHEQGRLSDMIRELFAELFIKLNPYVVESHDIATYIKNLERVENQHTLS